VRRFRLAGPRKLNNHREFALGCNREPSQVTADQVALPLGSDNPRPRLLATRSVYLAWADALNVATGWI